ncbi:MAG: hypothetical protein ISN28_06330 [Ectothiorhodospiraceae bacterium AqS1]|nr:hypothetical protein [Ectothiorhodospiraceae bacterium AqS1]
MLSTWPIFGGFAFIAAAVIYARNRLFPTMQVSWKAFFGNLFFYITAWTLHLDALEMTLSEVIFSCCVTFIVAYHFYCLQPGEEAKKKWRNEEFIPYLLMTCAFVAAAILITALR